MSGNTVRRAVRETLFSPSTPQAPPAARMPKDRLGTRGIATVLRFLHQPTVAEPMPPDLQRLLERLDRAEGPDKA